jgi:tetratricopeptide (TPR) repeat protein
VRASRDLRHEREARDEAQRNLLAQQARVAATRKALVRARAVAAVSVVLMLVAGASAIFGWVNFNRARVADAEAQQARQLADHARTEAESLVSFLIEDFYEELEPTGRLEIMASLAGRAVAYYDGLPEALVTPATRLNHGMALVREGYALGAGGDLAGAAVRIDRGLAIFEALQDDPHYRDQAHFGIGLALYSRHIGNLLPATIEADLTRAAELLRPVAESPGAARRTRFLYAEVLHGLSYSLRDEGRIEATEQARALVAGMGALDLSDLAATSIYADAADSQSRHALALGRVDEAAALSLEMYGLVEQVLARRPGDLRALQNRYYAADTLSLLAQRRFDLAAALDFAARAEQAGEDLVRFNPSSLSSWTSWAQGRMRVAAVLERQGRIADAIGMYRSATVLAQDDRAPPDLLHQLRGAWINVAFLEAGLGRTALAREAFAQSAVGYEALVERLPEGSDILLLNQLFFEAQQAQMELMLGDSRLANEKARSVAERAAALGPDAPPQRNAVLRSGLAWATDSALRVGRYSEAESAARARLEVATVGAAANDPVDLDAETRVGLAHAIARQGRPAEALEALEPAMARFRELWWADIRETRFQRNFAHALYVTAIAQPEDAAGQARRQAALAEAADVLAAVPAEARRMSDIRAVAEWIAAAGGAAPGLLAP